MGYGGVEWRIFKPPMPGAEVKSFWDGNRCGVDPATVVEQTPSLRELCRKNKLAMPVLATYLGYKDLELAERALEAATVLGAKGVRIGVDAYNGKVRYEKLLAKTLKGWEKIIRLGDKYSVKPLAEIHHGSLIPSASAAWRFASNFGPRDMGIIHDAGNMIREGFEQWQMGLEILGRYLAHVHVKNSSWSIQEAGKDGALTWKASFDTLLRGQVDWDEMIFALKKVGYRGWLSLEDFGPGLSDERLADDVKYLKKIIKG